VQAVTPQQNQLPKRRQRFTWRILIAYSFAFLLVIAGIFLFILSIINDLVFIPIFLAAFLFALGATIILLTFLFSSKVPALIRGQRRQISNRRIPTNISPSTYPVQRSPSLRNVEQLPQFKNDPHQSYVTLASALQVLAFSVYTGPKISDSGIR
jgi:flagellar basal body-associated protein FliL